MLEPFAKLLFLLQTERQGVQEVTCNKIIITYIETKSLLHTLTSVEKDVNAVVIRLVQGNESLMRVNR